ncbi:hypothetical protein ABT010_28605, partial [Streptomyces sp. NPDC002668]
MWLNEGQHYLGNPRVGEQIAASLQSLLVRRDRGPILILGTLWHEYARQYSALPQPGAQDPHSRVRELLSGRTVAVPDAFDSRALNAAAALADSGDRLLADALTRARYHGHLTQELAATPELIHRYEQGSVGARAILDAAMDARRLGVERNMPDAFLTSAAAAYLTEHDYDSLLEDWAEAAYAELTRLVHGNRAPLRRVRPRPALGAPATPVLSQASLQALQLASCLEQHGRLTRHLLCPPDEFWHAALTYLASPDDLSNLAEAAQARTRMRWAYRLYDKAAEGGSTRALVGLAQLREAAGDREGAETAV